MAKFINISTGDKNFWMLKISNYEQLQEYAHVFAGKAWSGAKVCVSRIQQLNHISHLGGDPEATILKVMAESEADENGSFMFKPLEHTSKLISMKLGMMGDMLRKGHEIIVNENGGLCDLKTFLDIHNATVDKEITSDKIIYPKEIDKSRTYKLIILENDKEFDYDFRKITELRDNKKTLNNLKSRGLEEISFYLSTCEEVITKTTFLNKEQTLEFIRAFAMLEGKIIKIVSDNTDTLMENLATEEFKIPFKKAISKNKVIFYNSSLEQINLEF